MTATADRSLGERVLGKLFPRSRFGPSWYRLGEFVTFREDGFAAAPSIPHLMARHYHEVHYLRHAVDLLRKRGVQGDASLEVGCGFGRLSPYLAEHFRQHTAIDINESALTSATSLYPHIQFRKASATELPFPDASFDLVMTWTVLQHIPPSSIQRALSEVRRVLRPRAGLILCEATRNASPTVSPSAHTQDRTQDFYVAAFPGHELVQAGDLAEIDRMPGMASPGRLMVLAPRG